MVRSKIGRTGNYVVRDVLGLDWSGWLAVFASGWSWSARLSI